ncbi:MAG: glycine--tRNA ligase subunit beta [Peptococcaceae bacterium]|jgi:glycyl-tRNA synthetase beta chain|nr:glycine--tRNA ligase subunit beta [Peptococcaceae bacterium]
MSDYLLEIGTEEIPAVFMGDILRQIKALGEKALNERRISFESAEALGTPRRLAWLVYGIAGKGADVEEEVRGPAKKAAFDPEGNPSKAAQGFARSQGVRIEDLTVKAHGNGEYVFAVRKVEGQSAPEALREIAPALIGALNFPKPMRWGSLDFYFVRPIRWIVSLLDGQVVPFETAGAAAGDRSRGHRFLSKGDVVLSGALNYREEMKRCFVMADPRERRDECRRQIQEAAGACGGKAEEDPGLLEEVTFLLEWPAALAGDFDRSYLNMPDEVVVTPMREHQRYFPVRDSDGRLMNRFVTVRNGNERDLETVRAGNERVLAARLSDARFFWDEDRKQLLEAYLPKLRGIVFQEKLGTVAQKVSRVEALTDVLAARLNVGETARRDALRIARLCKADLVTHMVYEFPELQGVMGRYYALESGEKEAVAQGIWEHYKPRFAGDTVPESLPGALVALADKMDTIAGIFAIGIEPTGSQDPYALRRQAMGVCAIVLKHRLFHSMQDLIRIALDNYEGALPAEQLGGDVLNRIRAFFIMRIRNILSEEGARHDVIDAVLSGEWGALQSLEDRARALMAMRKDQAFIRLLGGFTRAYNLTKKAASAEVDADVLNDPAEKQLYAVLEQVKAALSRWSPEELTEARYIQVIQELSQLAEPIDRFFEAVMVMAEDQKLRESRIGLLQKIVAVSVRFIGDLSKITDG